MTPIVKLENVSKIYPGPPEVYALQDCSLTINRGDFVTVVGPSGSGKSTLLNILGLLDFQTGGSYLLNGTAYNGRSEKIQAKTRGSKIGFVFQSFHLLEDRSCLENVMLADLYTGVSASDSRRSAAAALAAVGLSAKTSSLPTMLSGGQQQRVAIARAIANKPELLLCDEPTGNLDSETSKNVIALFQELNRAGHTIVLITHNPEIAAFGNRQITILDGKLYESVSPAP